MRITVCFKTMADSAMMAAQDWRADENLQVENGFARRMFNCFDESALELALRLARQFEEDPAAEQTESDDPSELTALTVDDARAELWLRHLYAVGFHHGIRLEPPAGADLMFAPGLVARLMATQLRASGLPDLILTGIRSGEGDNRQTGPLVAESLGWPCLNNVVAARPGRNRAQLSVTCLLNGQSLTRTIRTPAVLAVGNSAELPGLRQPTIKQRMQAKSRPVEVRKAIEMGINPSYLSGAQGSLVSLEPRSTARPGEMITGQNTEEKIYRLFNDHLKDRLAQ